MWQGAEDDVRLVERRVVGGHVRDLLPAKVHRLAALLVRGCERQREIRMLQEQRTKLAPSVTAGAEHSHLNLIHE